MALRYQVSEGRGLVSGLPRKHGLFGGRYDRDFSSGKGARMGYLDRVAW
jgi:hypothetical protein